MRDPSSPTIPIGPRPHGLRIATWNVLAQAYVKPERYPLSPPEALAREPRRRLLLEQLVAMDADAWCLQEVEPDVWDAILAAMPGYVGVYGQKRGKPDGAGVLYRASALTLVDHEVLHYRAVAPGSDHVAVVCRLRHGDRALVIASTHLRWQGREVPIDRHLGRLQLLELLARVDAAGPEPARVLCGDFNAEFESVVLREALDRGYELSCRAQRPWDTVNVDGRLRKLDYLLYTPAHLAPHPDPLPPLEPTTPMPSSRFPSDHLPVRVTYTWRA